MWGKDTKPWTPVWTGLGPDVASVRGRVTCHAQRSSPRSKVDAAGVSIYNFNSKLSCGGKQADVKGSDGQGKNERKENCNYGSLWSGGRYVDAEERVEAEWEEGVLGS